MGQADRTAKAREAKAAKARAARAAEEAVGRGQTAGMIAGLLSHRELSYDEIASRVRQELAGARTTARSVASVASRLRRGGMAVPDRRFGTPPTPPKAA